MRSVGLLSVVVWLIVSSTFSGLLTTNAYDVPEPRIEVLNPVGFRVSIPDEDGIKVFEFNGLKNVRFKGSERGNLAGSVQLEDDGDEKRWVFTNTITTFQPGDKIYYWVYVQHNSLGYSLSNQRFTVPGDTQPTKSTISTTTTSRAITTKTTIPTVKPSVCIPSITTILGRAQCRGTLVFDDNFDRPNLMPTWKHEVRIPLDWNDAEFVSYQSDESLCKVANGQLHIQPKLQVNEPGFGRIHFNINLDLGTNCTPIADRNLECSRQAWAYQILPPIVSCKLNTRDTFRFKYGRIVIRAKLPKGDWIFPELFLEPFANTYGPGYDSGQLRVAFIRSNDELYTRDMDNIGGRTLFGGAVLSNREEQRNTFLQNKTNFDHFGNEFHVYTLIWTDTEISLQVDGEPYGRIVGDDIRIRGATGASWRSGGNMAPFDQEFYLSVGVGSGGIADFPDESSTGGGIDRRIVKPWRNDDPKAELNFWNDRANWESTWTRDSIRMEIDYVRVFAI